MPPAVMPPPSTLRIAATRRWVVVPETITATHRASYGVARLHDATEADAPILTALEESVGSAALGHIFPPARYPFPTQQILDRWRRELADPTYRVRVAEMSVTDGPGTPRRHELAGYCVSRRDGAAAWIEHLGVIAPLRGSGLAALLLAEARNAFLDVDMRLWVLRDNARARRFYEREGWVPTGEESAAAYPPYPAMLEYLSVC